MKAISDVEGGKPPHILLVEDHPAEVRALMTLMQAQRWKVSLSTDPRSGYMKALALRPSLILLDVGLPGMDGFALCRLLREAPETQHTPIIFLTSANQLDERLTGLSLGGGDYVIKPCEPKEVMARIQIHLHLAAGARGQAASPAADATPGDGETVLLRAALRFIETHLEALPSLAEIAQSVGTHEKRLSQIFRQHLGSTVFAFVRQLRLRKAEELLATSGLSVQDVAETVGFQNAANFATAFREERGMTPSEFRRQARNRGQDA